MRKQYIYQCKEKKEDPADIVRWLRRNFGYRGAGWDFYLTRGNVIIYIDDTRLQLMYEMWKE